MANTATVGTLTKVTDYTVSNKRYRVRDVQINPAGGNDNYLAGGKTITAAAVGLHKIEEAVPLSSATNGTLKYDTSFDYTNSKLKVWGVNAVPGAAVGDPELTAGTDLNTYSVRYRFSGF